MALSRLDAQALEAGATGHRARWDALWGRRHVQVRDQDGNPIDLRANLEKSETL